LIDSPTADSGFPSGDPIPEDWFRRSFGGDYLRVYRARNEVAAVREARFAMKALSLPPGARVLDLACGAGRHSAPLAEAQLVVTGLDLSPDLLEHAQSRVGQQVSLVRGDMRSLPFGAEFQAVLSFFTSFGYFSEQGEDVRVLREMGRVVQPAGALFLDLPDRERTIENLIPESRRVEGELTIEERRRISADHRRVEKEVRFQNGSEEEVYFESVRLYSRQEIVGALEQTGWSLQTMYGDYQGEDWCSGLVPRMICVAKRTGAVE